MHADAHISVARTDVRTGSIARHLARRYEAGRAYAVTTGLGMPRTWPISTTAALEGFERALVDTKGGDAADRLKSALTGARAALAEKCDQLVERHLPDATLVALMLSEGELHVMSAGPGRVYLQRHGKPKRLTSRDETSAGLLRARPTVCTTSVEPGDLLLVGSVTAFSTSSIAKAISVLTSDPDTSPAVLASLLTEPAAKAGVGAAAVVLRVR